MSLLFKNLKQKNDPYKFLNNLEKEKMIKICRSLASKPCPYDRVNAGIDGCAGTGIIEDRQEDHIALLPCSCVIDNLESNVRKQNEY